MNTITKIQVQSKDKSRVNLYLDNKFFCGLDMETAVKHSLKPGTIISEEKLTEIQMESEKQSAYNKALKLVSIRYKTQREIERYLYEKGYLSQVVYYVLSRLIEYHFVDDERFVNSFIQTHKDRYGKLKLKQQLMIRGVSENLIDSAISEVDFDQTDEIIMLAEKYMKSKEPTKENYAKLFKYLMGKGFEYENVKRALKQDFEI